MNLRTVDLPVDRLTERASKLAQPGESFLALDGSSNTASTWFSPKLVAMAQSQGIPKERLGKMGVDLLIAEVIDPVLQELPKEVAGSTGLILDVPHYPLAGSGNHDITKVMRDGQEIPFSVAAANMGMPLGMKADGLGADVNHMVMHNGKPINVWEQLEEPGMLDFLKTHFRTFGKSALERMIAARAASAQAGAALAQGITPMPEPDVLAETSIDADKTFAAYMDYYDKLMAHMALAFPDWKAADLGGLMGTKLGPVEDGEFTNGPSKRSETRVIKSTAQKTAQLITGVREKFGIGFYRMLTNGRRLEDMLRVVDGVNKILNEEEGGVSLGTSFSSGVTGEVISVAEPVIGQNQEIKFEGTGNAKRFLREALIASHEASKGTMDRKDYPLVFGER